MLTADQRWGKVRDKNAGTSLAAGRFARYQQNRCMARATVADNVQEAPETRDEIGKG